MKLLRRAFQNARTRVVVFAFVQTCLCEFILVNSYHAKLKQNALLLNLKPYESRFHKNPM